jgi:hypothetical protein
MLEFYKLTCKYAIAVSSTEFGKKKTDQIFARGVIPNMFPLLVNFCLFTFFKKIV